LGARPRRSETTLPLRRPSLLFCISASFSIGSTYCCLTSEERAEALFVTSSELPTETQRLLLLYCCANPTANMRFFGALFSSSLWLLLLLQTLHSDVLAATMDAPEGTAAPTPEGTYFEVLDEDLLKEIMDEETYSPSAEESVLEGLGLETKPTGQEAAPPIVVSEEEDGFEETVLGEVSLETLLEPLMEQDEKDSTAAAAPPMAYYANNNTDVEVIEVISMHDEMEQMLEDEEEESTSTSTRPPLAGGVPLVPVAATVAPTLDETPPPSSDGALDKTKQDVEYVPPPIEDPLEATAVEDEEIAERWSHNNDWSNKTPQELAQFAQDEAGNMMHDKYVPLVAVAVALVCFGFLMVVVQQLVENPQGCLAKTCRCTVAGLRILCWPVKNLLCCGLCCKSSARQPGHQILHDRDLKDSGHFSDEAEFV